MKPRSLAAAGALAAIAAAGMVPWPVTGPVQGWLSRSARGTALSPTVERAVWTPWRSLELTGFRLSSPLRGELRASRVEAVPAWPGLALGRLRLKCKFEEVRWDPGSGEQIRVDGKGALRLEWGGPVLEGLTLEGPAVRLRAEGWLRGGREARFVLEGEVARALLERMKWSEAAGPSGREWEPFQLQVEGPLARPGIRFTSPFLTFSMNT